MPRGPAAGSPSSLVRRDSEPDCRSAVLADGADARSRARRRAAAGAGRRAAPPRRAAPTDDVPALGGLGGDRADLLAGGAERRPGDAAAGRADRLAGPARVCRASLTA